MHKIYKFVVENTEFHVNKKDNGYEFICLVDVDDASEFYCALKESFGSGVFDDGGIECHFMDGYIGVDIYEFVCDNDVNDIWFKLFKDIVNF